MSDQKISYKRLKELERAEAKLEALEAGGVDNWDGYDFALEGYKAAMDLEARREDLMEDLLSELGSGAYEPSERGAGFAFHDDAVEKAMRVLDTYGVTFKGKSDG